MSFSRQYAKDRHDKQPNTPVMPVSVKRSLASFTPPEKKTFSREKFRERKEALKAKQLQWQKRQNQALRLNAEKTVDKVPTLLRWKGVFLSILLIVFVIGLGMVWRHKDQWIFPIQKVVVEANVEQLNSPELNQLLQKEARGSLLLRFPQTLSHKIKKFPWVDNVTVKPVWPDELHIRIMQKIPVAHFGSAQFLDDQGTLFTPVNSPSYGHLAYIDGPSDQARPLLKAYETLSALLEPIDLRITRLDVTQRLAYTLTLSNGIVVYLGSNDVVSRLETFVKVYEKVLAPRASEVDHVDMRYGSGMAVKWKKL